MDALSTKLEESKLNMMQREFVRLYLTGPDGVRGVGKASAIAAGYKENSAHVLASRILARDDVRMLVREFHRIADAVAINKLKDWKEVAVDAQDIVIGICDGSVSSDEPFELSVRLQAAKEILDRAFGKVTKRMEVTGKDGDSLIPIDAVRKALAEAESGNN